MELKKKKKKKLMETMGIEEGKTSLEQQKRNRLN